MTAEIDRRTFVKTCGLATGVAATGVGASRLDLAPVGDARAVNPFILDGAMDVAWALRSAWDVLAPEDASDGLTADALQNQIEQSAVTRESVTDSTIVDNRNILDGIDNNAWIDGKIAAFEALNNGETQQSVEDAATSVVTDYQVTIQGNLIKSWNEAVRELEMWYQTVSSHSDASSGFLTLREDNIYNSTSSPVRQAQSPNLDYGDYTTVQYGDGTTHEVLPYGIDGSGNKMWTFLGDDATDSQEADAYVTIGGTEYLSTTKWRNLWNDMNTAFDDVRNGLILWVDGVYGQVQSGQVEVSDLITPRERAAMMTDDGKFPQAVADLIALNVPVDLEREATVSLDYKGVTLTGSLAITSPPDTLESGVQYNPTDDNLGTVYLTYDVGSGEGVWTSYLTSIDGGTVTFESEPYTDVTYRISTNYDEVAEVTAGDFTQGTDGSGNAIWTTDVSGQLDNPIAEITEVTYVTPTEETRYETVQITGNFTVEKFTNKETGEEESSANFESSEPQDDTNYVTQDEWDQMVQQNQELIDAWEASQTDGSSGGGGSSNSGFLSGEWMGVPKAGWLLGGSGASLLGYELFTDDDDHGRRGGGRY